jgi:hypothetical protein
MVNSKSKVFYKGKRIFVGIDVHKKRWVVTVRTYDLELKTFSMQPSAEELERFLLDNYDGALIHIVYECCFSGFWIYDYFHQRGYKIIVTPVNRVYWDGSIVKTDKIDSRKFAFQHSRDLLRKVKNGSVIRGIIVESIPNKSVKIQTKDGNIFFYNIDEIEKITKEVSDDSFSDKNDSKIVSQTQSGSLFIGGEIYYSSVSTKYNYSLNRFMFALKNWIFCS